MTKEFCDLCEKEVKTPISFILGSPDKVSNKTYLFTDELGRHCESYAKAGFCGVLCPECAEKLAEKIDGYNKFWTL